MKERRSPFSDHGSTRRAATPMDDEILLALDPVKGFKLLPTNYIPLFVNFWQLNVRERAGELARKPDGDTCPNKVLRDFHDVRCPTRNKNIEKARRICNCTPMQVEEPYECPHKLLRYVLFAGKNASQVRYYYRTPAGDDYLKDRGLIAGRRRPPGKNMHQAMVDIWRARLVYGSRDTDHRYQDWPALLKRDRMPESTKKSEHPFRLYLGQEYTLPDAAPFSLNGFLYLFEMDCNTEDISYSDEKNTIEGKLIFYRNLIKVHVPHRLYGLQEKPNPVRLIIETVTEARRQTIKGRIFELLGPCDWILLGVTENYPKLNKKPPVNTHSLTQMYQRAGHPDISLEKEV